MKIILLSHTGGVTGGAEQCLLEYLEVLRSKGHKCKVIVPYEGAMSSALTTKGYSWIAIGYGWATRPHRNVHPHRIMTSTGNSLVRIYQEIEKYKPQVIITNTSVIPWGLYAGKSFDVPTILLVHEILNEKDPSLKVVPSYSKYGKILNEYTDYVVYNSEFVKGEFATTLIKPKTSSKILYPLPPLDSYKIKQFYKDNKIDGCLKIAIFGALSPRKNQMEALEAALILKNAGSKLFSIDLYGDVSANIKYTKDLRRFIKNNMLTDYVKIRGYATNVYEKMNEYNVILSTATYEPFGRTIIEGQLFGRIAVTNNTGGGLELVKHESTGYVYGSGNPGDLAETIKTIINNKEKALTLAKKAKSLQHDKYLIDDRYDALLEAVGQYESYKSMSRTDNIYEPTMALFQYNHQLNIRYKNLYRLTHNRITFIPIRAIRKAAKQSKILISRIIK